MDIGVIGKYELTGEKFSGGMGTVYVGCDPVLGRKVAIKVLHEHLSDKPGFTQRFVREARILAQLKHQNITQIYEAGECDEGPYLAMEYVEGETLEDCIFKGKYRDPAAVLPIIRQVCSALDHAHKQGIIHRDIKPSNIIVKPTGEAMLMDFGIAKISGVSGVTQDGTALGTPQYMSAEQCKGLSIDYRSDIYSLAIVVYEMLTNFRPFEGENVFSIINKQINNTPPSISVRNASLPGSICSAISRALSKDPSNRQQSAMEFYRNLTAAQSRSESTIPSRKWLYVAGGVALAGLISVLAISLNLWFGSSQETKPIIVKPNPITSTGKPPGPPPVVPTAPKPVVTKPSSTNVSVGFTRPGSGVAVRVAAPGTAGASKVGPHTGTAFAKPTSQPKGVHPRPKNQPHAGGTTKPNNSGNSGGMPPPDGDTLPKAD